MALNKNQLKNDIKSLMNNMRNQTEQNDDAFADGLASIIETYVKSGTVTIQAGIPLIAGAYTGQTTATGTGSIS